MGYEAFQIFAHCAEPVGAELGETVSTPIFYLRR